MWICSGKFFHRHYEHGLVFIFIKLRWINHHEIVRLKSERPAQVIALFFREARLESFWIYPYSRHVADICLKRTFRPFIILVVNRDERVGMSCHETLNWIID